SLYSYACHRTLLSLPTRRSSDLLQWREKVIDPLYEHKTDGEIAYLLAKKLGFADQMFKNIKVVNNVPEPESVQVGDLAVGLVLRSEEHTSELQSRENLVCRLLLE